MKDGKLNSPVISATQGAQTTFPENIGENFQIHPHASAVMISQIAIRFNIHE